MINIFKFIAIQYNTFNENEELYDLIITSFTFFVYLFIGVYGVFYKIISLFSTIPIILVGLFPIIIEYFKKEGLEEYLAVLNSDSGTFVLLICMTLFISLLVYLIGSYAILIGAMVYLQKNYEMNLCNFISIYMILISLTIFLTLFYKVIQNLICGIIFSFVASFMIVISFEKLFFSVGFIEYVLRNEVLNLNDKEMLVFLATFMYFCGVQGTLGVISCKKKEDKK